jgi:hypothetical protein
MKVTVKQLVWDGEFDPSEFPEEATVERSTNGNSVVTYRDELTEDEIDNLYDTADIISISTYS